MKTAEELYDGKETTEEGIVVEEPKGEEETKQEETKEESEKESKEETKSEEETKDESPSSVEETKVPISAMHGERDRRQAAEKENAELRAKIDESNKADPTSVFGLIVSSSHPPTNTLGITPHVDFYPTATTRPEQVGDHRDESPTIAVT